MKKENFFSKLKKICPSDDEKNRTKEINKTIGIKIGQELKQIQLKSDVILLADVFEKVINLSTKKHVIKPFELFEFTWLYVSMCFELYR